MTKPISRHFLDILAEVPDPRKSRGKRHPLSALIGLAVVAMLTGARSYTAIAEWGRLQSAELRDALGFKHAKTPCASPLHYVFKRLDAAALETTLTDVAKAHKLWRLYEIQSSHSYAAEAIHISQRHSDF